MVEKSRLAKGTLWLETMLSNLFIQPLKVWIFNERCRA